MVECVVLADDFLFGLGKDLKIKGGLLRWCHAEHAQLAMAAFQIAEHVLIQGVTFVLKGINVWRSTFNFQLN